MLQVFKVTTAMSYWSSKMILGDIHTSSHPHLYAFSIKGDFSF